MASGYVSIKYDLAFKRVFTQLDILKAFLNTTLKDVIEKPIVKVSLKPTDFIARGKNKHVLMDTKHTVIDVFCIDQAGRRILVELQKGSKLNALPRFLDYQCRNYSSQFEVGSKYETVVPCYTICWLFDIKPPHHFIIEELRIQSNRKTTHWNFDWSILALYPRNLDWKRLEQAGTQEELEEWLLLDVVRDLKRAKRIKKLIHNPHINAAFSQLDLSAYTDQQVKELNFQLVKEEYPDELDNYIAKQFEKERAKLAAEQKAALKKKEAEKQAALKKKEAEKQAALKEKSVAIAKSLLGLLDITIISEKTGLSITEIENLTN